MESSSRGNNQNSNSIIFYKPNIILKKDKNRINFLNKFNDLWKSNKVFQNNTRYREKDLPFCGGWFLYLGYEIAKEIEKSLNIPESPYSLPDAFAARVHSAIIYNHVDRNMILITDKEDCFDDIDEMEADLENMNSSLDSQKLKDLLRFTPKEVQMNTRNK